jgi:Domain of unknown function DUF29
MIIARCGVAASFRPCPVKGRLYDRDFFVWSRQQADPPRAGKLAEADVERIAEEIESGKARVRQPPQRPPAAPPQWRYRPDKRGPSCAVSILFPRADRGAGQGPDKQGLRKAAAERKSVAVTLSRSRWSVGARPAPPFGHQKMSRSQSRPPRSPGDHCELGHSVRLACVLSGRTRVVALAGSTAMPTPRLILTLLLVGIVPAFVPMTPAGARGGGGHGSSPRHPAEIPAQPVQLGAFNPDNASNTFPANALSTDPNAGVLRVSSQSEISGLSGARYACIVDRVGHGCFVNGPPNVRSGSHCYCGQYNGFTR